MAHHPTARDVSQAADLLVEVKSKFYIKRTILRSFAPQRGVDDYGVGFSH